MNHLSNKILIKIFLLISAASLSAFGFEFKTTGEASTFSKIGFDTRKYDPQNGIYPTESYATIMAELNLEMNLATGLDLVIGGMLNGLVYDSTTWQGDGPLGYNYIGYFAGHSGQTLQSPRNAMVHNAYVSYHYKDIFGIQLGRYETQGYDWFSAYNQGGEAYLKYFDTKAWIFFSDARASAYNDWFWDYGRYYTDNKPLLAGGIKYSKNGFEISPYIYSIPQSMNAPGLSISYDSFPNFNSKGFRSKTLIVALFPIFERIDAATTDTTAFNETLGKNAQTLLIRQEFDIDTYNFGMILYKNFGNANGRIGIYGDPITFNVWTNSVYDKGPSLSDMLSKDALNGFLFVGSTFKDFKWQLLGRLTTSPRADEQSLALYLEYAFNKHIDAGLKIEYYRNVTHSGYAIGNGFVIAKGQHITSDRSHLMTHLTYTF